MNAPPEMSGGRAASAAGGAWLNRLAGHWIDGACAHLTRHAALVRVTVVALRGSAPREPGASMLIDDSGMLGTIGGGRLEWHAVRAARQLLCASDSPAVQIDDVILGPQLGQCCGGRVQLWLERLTREDLPWLQAASQSARNGGANAVETRFAAGIVSHNLRSLRDAAPLTLRRDAAGETLLETLGPRLSPLWVFGAGHVGQALVRLLAELALFDIRWIDPRPELLPAGLPEGVTTQACAAPVDLIGAAAAATRYVVLTHDHPLDYELCRSILERGDAAWLGLIGSASKAARFRARLRRDGIDPTRLTCPIGVPGIASKLPTAIAIAVAAQLLQLRAPSAVADAAAAVEAGAAAPPACDGACEICGQRCDDT
ncbi:MAG: xanthine dehydrogenase accessory protein XdhC [Steroidobacteraceae bacterium]